MVVEGKQAVSREEKRCKYVSQWTSSSHWVAGVYQSQSLSLSPPLQNWISLSNVRSQKESPTSAGNDFITVIAFHFVINKSTLLKENE